MYNLHPSLLLEYIGSVYYFVVMWCCFLFEHYSRNSTHRFKIMVYYALGIFTPMQTMWIRLARWQKGINIDCLLSYFIQILLWNLPPAVCILWENTPLVLMLCVCYLLYIRRTTGLFGCFIKLLTVRIQKCQYTSNRDEHMLVAL